MALPLPGNSHHCNGVLNVLAEAMRVLPAAPLPVCLFVLCRADGTEERLYHTPMNLKVFECSSIL